MGPFYRSVSTLLSLIVGVFICFVSFMQRPIWHTLWRLKLTARSTKNVLQLGAPWHSSVKYLFIPVWPGEPSHSSARYAIYQWGLYSRDIVLLDIELILAWPGEPAACRAVTLFYQSMSVYYGGLHNLPPGKPPHNFVKILAMPVWPEEPAAWRAVK